MKGEEVRVESFVRGEYAIGTQDLVRIFDLTTPPPPVSDIVVEQFNGLNHNRRTRFTGDGTFVSTEDPRKPSTKVAAATRSGAAAANAAFQFASPADCKSCKTCGQGNKK